MDTNIRQRELPAPFPGEYCRGKVLNDNRWFSCSLGSSTFF
jgi:hypothetical protein